MQRDTLIKQVGESWADLLAPFAATDTFDGIFAQLKKEKAEGAAIYPAGPNVFRAFRETPLDKVRVILLGMDPYPKEDYANGLAFGHASNLKKAASLEKIIDAVEVDAYAGLNFEKNNFDTTMETWAKQGILMLNTALTVKDSTPGSHTELWNEFTKEVITKLAMISRNLIWLAWGSQAQVVTKDINPFEHFLFTAEHPSKAAKEKKPWSCNHFSIVNSCITINKLGDKIIW